MQSIPLVSALVLLAILGSCSADSMVHVESANQNSRVDYLVIHATSENFAESLRLLTTETANPVSAHYLVPELNDATYPHDRLRMYSLVAEHRRAWHAGVSFWAGENSLNDRSIGIEVVNEFKCSGTEMPVELISLDAVDCTFPEYSEQQITLLIDLLKSILARYPGIDPLDIVGHSDIAIMRKSDPGPRFPWYRLYQAGIGAWPDEAVMARYRAGFTKEMPPVLSLQEALSGLGYRVEATGEMDAQTRFALRAFQLRFRPADYSGQVDSETVSLVWALLEKYRPGVLMDLDPEV